MYVDKQEVTKVAGLPCKKGKKNLPGISSPLNPYLAVRDNSRAGGGGGGAGLPTQKPVILTIYHMQPFRASVLIQE